MKKKISAICLLLALSLCNVAGAGAEEVDQVAYMMADTSQMCDEEIALREQLGMTDDIPQLFSTSITTGTILSIDSSGDAGCGGTISAGTDVKKIQIFLYLQKNSTKENINSWEESKDGRYFAMTRHHQLKAKGTYIVKMSAYVAKTDGTYENLVRYSHTDTY